MVSSAIPKVVPPKAKTIIRIGIINFSLPFSFFVIPLIAALMAPVLTITPRKPPTIRIKVATSIAS